MGLRAFKRQIAKARLAVIGVDRVNRKLSLTNKDGLQNWRVALTDEQAHRKQTAYSRRNKRKLRKVDCSGVAESVIDERTEKA